MVATKPIPVINPRFVVDDLEKWGYLVKMWATRDAYPDVPVMPIPHDLMEFRKQCDAIGLKVTIPDHVTGIVFSMHSIETLYVRLPPAAAIKNVEEFLMDPRTDYPVPPIYNMYSPTPIQIPKDEKLEFHAARIGDYSMTYCD